MSTKEPKYDLKRGRHRKHASQETQEWNRDHRLPEQPPWMDRDTYLELMRLRAEKERTS